MCSVSGERGSWSSEDAFQQINSILDWLADEDIAATPAETMGEDQIACGESRVEFKPRSCAASVASTAGRVTPTLWL